MTDILLIVALIAQRAHLSTFIAGLFFYNPARSLTSTSHTLAPKTLLTPALVYSFATIFDLLFVNARFVDKLSTGLYETNVFGPNNGLFVAPSTHNLLSHFSFSPLSLLVILIVPILALSAKFRLPDIVVDISISVVALVPIFSICFVIIPILI